MMRALKVTLATATSVTYNLATLIAADSKVVADVALAVNFPYMCKQLIMQTAVGTVTFVDANGDAGPVYASASVITFGPFDANNIDLNSIYMIGGTTNTTVAIIVLD